MSTNLNSARPASSSDGVRTPLSAPAESARVADRTPPMHARRFSPSSQREASEQSRPNIREISKQAADESIQAVGGVRSRRVGALERLASNIKKEESADFDGSSVKIQGMKMMLASAALSPIFCAIISKPGSASTSEQKRAAAMNMLNASHVLTEVLAESGGFGAMNNIDKLQLRKTVSAMIAQKWRSDGVSDVSQEVTAIAEILQRPDVVYELSNWGDWRQAESDADANLMLKLSAMKAFAPIMTDISQTWCFWKSPEERKALAENLFDGLSRMSLAFSDQAISDAQVSPSSRLMYSQSIIDKVCSFAKEEYASLAREAITEFTEASKTRETVPAVKKKWSAIDIELVILPRVEGVMNAFLGAVDRFVRKSDEPRQPDVNPN